MKIKIDFNSFKFRRYYLIFVVGFLTNFQPSSIFNYEYLIKFKETINSDSIGQDLYPTIVYSAVIQSILIAFIIDLCNYTPLVIIFSASSLLYCCLLIWTDTLIQLQIAQAIFGTFFATEIAYLIVIFLFIDKDNYKKFTSYIRIAPLIGNALAYLLAQLLVSQEYLNYKQLHYITLGATISGLIVALFLPFPPNEYYKIIKKSTDNRVGDTLKEFSANLKEAFSDKYIVKWTLWYTLSLCGYRQAILYIQLLWRYNHQHSDYSYYNGLIDGLLSVFCIFAVLIGGFSQLNWRFTGDLILTVTSLSQGFMLMFLSQFTNPTISCLFYIIFGVCYYHTITSLTGELLKSLKKPQFGIVFGLIYCFSGVIQTIIIALISDDLGFDAKQQFFIYGIYHFFIAILFIIIGLISWYAKKTYPI